MKQILILTIPGDLHAYAVADALEQKGAHVVLSHTSNFPQREAQNVRLCNGTISVSLRGPEFALTNPSFDTVWHRRLAHVMDDAALHPADRTYADLACQSFQDAFLSMLSPEAFWVNPRERAMRADRKLFQLSVASVAGMTIPDTLITNDPEEIRSFIRQHGGQIAFKPVRPSPPWRDGETDYVTYTNLLTEEQLVDDRLLMQAPAIYQAFIPKAYELRVTVMGCRVFGAKLLSQDTETGKVDWRKSYHEIRMEPYELPHRVADLCCELLSRLGLVFGCFDFIVTPDGKYVFLEVNEGGQFLFVEMYTGLPLLDAFSEFLLQGRADFDWKEGSPIRFSTLSDQVRERIKRDCETNVQVPEAVLKEG